MIAAVKPHQSPGLRVTGNGHDVTKQNVVRPDADALVDAAVKADQSRLQPRTAGGAGLSVGGGKTLVHCRFTAKQRRQGFLSGRQGIDA